MRVSCVQTQWYMASSQRVYQWKSSTLEEFSKGRRRAQEKLQNNTTSTENWLQAYETALKSQFLTLFLVMALVYNCQEDPGITLCPQMFKWNSVSQSVNHWPRVGIALTGQLQTMMDTMKMLRWCWQRWSWRWHYWCWWWLQRCDDNDGEDDNGRHFCCWCWRRVNAAA